MIERKFNVFVFMDYETTGTNPHYDMAIQGAMVKTDGNLNVIKGSETNVIVKPRPDVPPHPMAFLVTNIDINILKQHGITEFEFSRVMQDAFTSQEASCMSGYNTISFDDEFTRTLMFRNMKAPYEHEWKNKNGRMDVFKLAQLTYAFFPNLIEFPEVDGKVSLKLEYLSKANGIIHENAHDALSDVFATIELAKLIKEKRPTLFTHFLNLSDKRNCDELLLDKKPVYFTTSYFNRDFHSTSLILPVIKDMDNANKVHCVDLRYDPTELLSMSPDDIKKYLFTKREDLPEGSPTLPVSSVQINKQPMLSPFNGSMSPAISERFQLDLEKVMKHKAMIEADPSFAHRLQLAMKGEPLIPKDAYSSLYSGGFISNNDAFERAKMHYVDSNKSDEEFRIESVDVFTVGMGMEDSVRETDLLLRAKWNSFYEKILAGGSFNKDELKEWTKYLENRLEKGVGDDKALTFDGFEKEMKEVRLNNAITEPQEEILAALEQHVDELKGLLKNLKEIVATLDRNEQEHVSIPAYEHYLNGSSKSQSAGLSM